MPPTKDILWSGNRLQIGSGDLEELTSEGAWNNFGLMLYGSPGVGKTWLACTACQVPELSPVLLIDNDGGSKTVRGKANFKGIKILRVRRIEAYNKIYEMLTTNVMDYRTVIIDNLGALHTMAMEFEMERVCKADPAREPNVPSQREYGIVRAMIHKLVKFYESLPLNLIVTAHAELDKDELTGATRVRPAIAGKLSFEVPGFLDINGYLTVVKKSSALGAKPVVASQSGKGGATLDRVVQFQPTNRIDAKDESNALGEEMLDPTMLKIATAIGVVSSKK